MRIHDICLALDGSPGLLPYVQNYLPVLWDAENTFFAETKTTSLLSPPRSDNTYNTPLPVPTKAYCSLTCLMNIVNSVRHNEVLHQAALFFSGKYCKRREESRRAFRNLGFQSTSVLFRASESAHSPCIQQAS